MGRDFEMSSRIYQNVALTLDSIVNLDGQACHYLIHVLRAKVGDQLTLFNGCGGEYQARICEINKKNVSVIVNHFIDQHSASPIKIILGQGIARGEKMDFIVQKSVELGVDTLIPLITERCNNRWVSAKRLDHWREVAVSACEQSGRNDVPKIIEPQHLDAWLHVVSADKRFVLSPHTENSETVTTTLAREQLPLGSSIALLIGPEGGFSQTEITSAQQCGFASIKLGPRILRTETAALTALAVMQFCYGDFA